MCLDGYIGMDNPSAAGGTSPADPTLDPNALAATPYVYLIPVGQDSMRSPPLGDASAIRSWNVDDVTIPLPFNISAADFSSTPFYTSANSLSEPLFAVRAHQAFRPVSTTTVFNTSIYGANGALQPSQYTNTRLIGRPEASASATARIPWMMIVSGMATQDRGNAPRAQRAAIGAARAGVLRSAYRPVTCTSRQATSCTHRTAEAA